MGRTALRRLLALGLLGSLSLTATAGAAAPVWAIRGAHNTVYLAGSVHLLPRGESRLPAAFDRAYADSSRVVMEMDIGATDPLATAQWLTEHGALPDGTTLRAVMGEASYARARDAAGSLGLDMQLLDGQAPWVVALELADLEYLRRGMDPQQGVEQQLLRRAQSDHKPTAGLETLDQELGGLTALPRADQVHLLEQTVDELQQPDTQTHDIVQAWRGGDARRLQTTLAREYRSFPSLYRTLVTERNRQWLPRIEQLLHGNDNSLVVVGSLHLVGSAGLLELLRRDGFSAEQLD